MTPLVIALFAILCVLAAVCGYLISIVLRCQKTEYGLRSEVDRLKQNQTTESELIEREQRLVSKESELQRVSGLSKDEAKEELIQFVVKQAEIEATERSREIEENILADSKKHLLDAMERTAMQYAVENTTALVELPSEDVKGRIIGREGRNIRSFEQITGVDLIIDETPEAVMISSFDPVRRETARLTLINLIVDGRIHPARIEELHDKAKKEVHRMILESANKATSQASVSKLPKPVLEALGKLRFRSSYAQNVLDHSVEVALLGSKIAYELGYNVEVVKRSGLLHDIGKALGEEWEGPHALTGMAFLKQYQESEIVLNAVGAHHREIEPTSPEAQIVIIADILSASRPGARRENLDAYLKRMTALEALANSFPGVERSYAVQAGREIRVVVKPEVLTDAQSRTLATELGTAIKAQMEVPGQIKIVVLRESRFTEIVK